MATRVTIHASPLLLQRGVRGVAGEPMEVVLHLPTAPVLSQAGFVFESAFPGPALLAAVPQLVLAAIAVPDARLMVFGHAAEKSGDDANKKLADRRAKVLLSLLTGELALFDEVASADGWALVQYQSMLKTLGISPMEVDGKPGPTTERGLKRFQKSYNAGDYHPASGRKRAHADLSCDGRLGADCEAALRDAYHALARGTLQTARFFGPKFAGCADFNRAGGSDKARVALALYRPSFPTEAKIPCKEGDAGSCKLHKQPKHPIKCNFYRRTLDAETPLAAATLAVLVKLRLHLLDPFGEPVASRPCQVSFGKSTESVMTDAQGYLTVSVPDGAKDVVVEVDGQRYPLEVGHLEPHDTPAGAAARLLNLGYASGNLATMIKDRSALLFGLRCFVHDQKFDTTGQPYLALLAELQKVYGS